MTKATYRKIKEFIGLVVSEADESVTILAWGMAAGGHGARAVAKKLHAEASTMRQRERVRECHGLVQPPNPLPVTHRLQHGHTPILKQFHKLGIKHSDM